MPHTHIHAVYEDNFSVQEYASTLVVRLYGSIRAYGAFIIYHGNCAGYVCILLTYQ